MISFNITHLGDHFDELEKRLRALHKAETFVGYSSEQGTHKPSGLSYPHLVGILSAGFSPHLPARPIFLVAGKKFKFQGSKVKKTLALYLKDIKTNKSDKQLKNVQKAFVRDFSKEVLDVFGDPSQLASNKPSTIAQKKVNKIDSPLVDTGELKDKLAFRLNQGAIQTVKKLG